MFRAEKIRGDGRKRATEAFTNIDDELTVMTAREPTPIALNTVNR